MGCDRSAVAHGSRGRAAVQLLVEVVAPPPDRLSERNRRCGTRGTDRDGNPSTLGHVHADDRAEQQAPWDPEPAVPDGRNLAPVVAEAVVVGDDVVEASADHAGEHRPDGDRTRIVLRADLAFLEALAEEPHRGDHAQRDHQAVEVEAEWTDVDRVERWAGNAGEHDRDDQPAATRATNSPARRLMSAAS